MTFDNLNLVSLLTLLALLFTCFAALSKWEKVLSFFKASVGVDSLNKGRKTFVFVQRLALISFTLTLIAWFRPVGQGEEIEQERKGIDIVVALDVSDSMRARDVKPDRITRAKRELEELLDRIRGDRVALVAFSGVAFLETPLTLDYGTFSLFLRDIEAGFIPVKGTNIEAALLKSLEALSVKKDGEDSKGLSNRSRAILLITDGEDFEGDWGEIKTRAKKSSTSIFIIGVGTEKGGTIPLARGVKKDSRGAPVITKLNRSALSKLAKETGGKYVDVSGSDSDSYQIYDLGLKTLLNDNEYEKQKYIRKAEFYQAPLLLSILLLAFSRLRYLGLLLVLFTIPILSSSRVYAEENSYLEAKQAYDIADYARASAVIDGLHKNQEPDFKSQMARGATSYRLGKFEDASKSFSASAALAQTSSEKAEAFYNSANSLAQLGKYEDAIKTYEQALDLAPEDQELKSNLDYVKKLLEQQNQQQDQQQDQKNDQKKEDQKENDSENKNSEDSQSKQNNSDQDKQDDQQSSQSEEEQDSETDQEQQQENNENDSSKNEEQEDGQDSEKSEPSESEKSEEEKQSEPTEGSGAQGEQKELEQQSILNKMLNGIEENTSASRKHKTRKALKELKRENLKPPEKDW